MTLKPFLAALLLSTPAAAQEFQTRAGSAIVIDHNTGQVLLSKNAQVPLPPASMSKLMTLNMAFEALEDGRLTMETELPVSDHAASFGGSTMFLDPRDRVTVEDLIRGIVVLSGNDATVVIAEALSPDGTEAGFADMMSERARELGMENSAFRNASGWPAPGHVMSMEDLAILAERLITEFPQYYPYFAETEFAFDGRSPANRFNRNPILRLDIGADGLKTGHTQEAGYGLVGSAVDGDRRVTFVISGIESEAVRAEESERIVNWAFRQFAEEQLFDDETATMHADVFMGEAPTVALEPAEELTVLLPTTGRQPLAGEISYDGPINAPIEAGQQIATLTLSHPGMEPWSVPLVAAEDVPRAGPLRRIQIAGGTVAGRLLDEVMARIEGEPETTATEEAPAEG
ncbi:D-alanyl-D-alanine carboxypeptidase family protein [Jannaschia aquimarina]|uniref:serine-type D-Ala-D-Ala carboxypeptidase n=1 Tax=Jannaschia aquimarina TaxID=935700 RepID=A0A0D1EJG5_9RHOB|nr:D-alanyl-D-alanine carboxypeptidase family protein [Jannaschia aquimarina]KIT17734.1 D-alanyl-D-alanine carboxypeptidase DacF precursor [Jannaschia aquimarina]SNS96682.1 D-alanyl-D-alanine carboxypeptidase (penicillin-binding protein 5/6) [Jannaschia aquimarina]